MLLSNNTTQLAFLPQPLADFEIGGQADSLFFSAFYVFLCLWPGQKKDNKYGPYDDVNNVKYVN